MAPASGSGKSLAELLTKVIELGGDGLEVEYKDGYEEITAMKANLGVGLGNIKSNSPEATTLRNELWSLRNRTKRIEVEGRIYKARVTTFDSFGETAYRMEIL
ncbi:MAG: hypothetical protein ABSH28_18480 [Acidobacteriota bacterium]